jgi:hypothetical protein
MMMDNYGVTPKGQQDRRWLPRKDDAPLRAPDEDASPYRGLKVVT